MPVRQSCPSSPIGWILAGGVEIAFKSAARSATIPLHCRSQDTSASAAELTAPPGIVEVRRGGKEGVEVATTQVPQVEADALEKQVDSGRSSKLGSGAWTDVELGLELQPKPSPQPGP